MYVLILAGRPNLPSGTLRPPDAIVYCHLRWNSGRYGLGHAPGALIDLLRGANTGKMLVRL